MSKSATRRDKGNGTLYYDKARKCWRGNVTVGYSPDGVQRRKHVSHKTKAGARMLLQELIRKHEDGRFLTVAFTVAGYLERWLADKSRGLSARTSELYEEQILRYVNPRIGKIKISELRPGQAQQVIGHIADTVGVPTANKVRRLLLQAFRKAVQWRYIQENPFDAVDALKEERVKWALWSSEQVQTFMEHIQGDRLYPAFYLLLVTGLRRGELLGLRWSDLEGGQLHIQRSYTLLSGRPHWSEPKTENGRRTVTLPADALEVLEQHRDQQHHDGSASRDSLDVMFTTPTGEPISPNTFNGIWKRLQEAAGVPPIRLHDLRHMHVSWLVQLGFDPRVIADRVGHADASFTLDRYSHAFESRRQATAVPLDALLGGPRDSAAQDGQQTAG